MSKLNNKLLHDLVCQWYFTRLSTSDINTVKNDIKTDPNFNDYDPEQLKKFFCFSLKKKYKNYLYSKYIFFDENFNIPGLE